MPSLFGVEELYEQTVARLAALGSPLDHAFGSVHVGRMKLPNSYVWVPTSGRENKKNQPHGGADENRSIFGTEERFEVHCWGESHEVAYVMRQNVVHAMIFAIGGTAPLHYEGSEWMHEVEDETTLGNVLIARFWLDAAIPDSFVPVARFIRTTPQSPTDPGIPTTIPTSIVIDTYSTKSTTQPGDLVATDTVVPP